MFGTDTNTNQPQASSDGTMGLASTPMTTPTAPSISSSPAPTISTDTTAPVISIPDGSASTTAQSSIPEFVPPDDEGHMTNTPALAATTPTATPDTHVPEDLMEIKKEALTKLGPLVDTMDQKPEDKFKTLMMMIQASDDQSLVAKAYEAANAIEDDKTRARALLDVINEINYFTSHNGEEEKTSTL